MANNQNYTVMTELVEQHQKRIKYLENKVLEYQAEKYEVTCDYFIAEFCS